MSVKKTFSFGFFGAGMLALHTLEILDQKYGLRPNVIVTKPNKPRGRNLKLRISEIKAWADSKKIPVYEPETLKDATAQETLTKFSCEVFVVVSYGKIIPEEVLFLPKYKTLNIHPSLLPKYRGPSPIQSAILSADKKIGVSLMLLDKEMDHGPILAQSALEMDPLKETAQDLSVSVAIEGSGLIAEKIPEFISGNIIPLPQDDKKATYTKKIEKEDGEIFLSGDQKKNILKFNAYLGWPGTYFFHNKNGKVIRVSVENARYADGKFILERVKPEGKNEMLFEEFVRGYGNPYKEN